MAMSISSLKGRIEAAMIVELGTPEDAAKLAKFANAIATAVYNEITTNADLDLLAGDIPVPATGISDSLAGPCTGSAQSGAANLSARIK